MSDDWLPAAFSKAVNRRREALQISQEELAKRSGLHRTYISDVERGARNISLKNMGRLAEALDTSPSQLIEWTEHLYANQPVNFGKVARQSDAVESEDTDLARTPVGVGANERAQLEIAS